MDISNYLYNRLLIWQNGPVFIPKEAYTGIKQNLEHVQIFGSRVSTFIPTKKCTKSDIRKTWKGILISYTGTSKLLKVWASHTHQVLIMSEPVVNKNKRGVDLLLEYLLPLSEKPFWP